ncbi:MAG: hypothetical protein KJO29_10700 [Bacteroidia bacterium]|nr:hypothetical protein [Bacteroidia bacterium]
MKIIIRNQASVANKYIRFAKWKIRQFNRKYNNILYAEVYFKNLSTKPRKYGLTVRLGLPGSDIVLTEKSGSLRKIWLKMSEKIKTSLRRRNDRTNQLGLLKSY